jgi:transcriptional regulator with AAA-type ATPase domain
MVDQSENLYAQSYGQYKESLKDPLCPLFGFSKFVSNTLEKRIPLIVHSGLNLLITGETGTGKEVIYTEVKNKFEKDRKFQAVNCASFSTTLIDSELFGHVRGAFTGATNDKKGIFDDLDGGVLFLDEIGSLSEELQAKLLRAIQEKEYRPVGSTEVTTLKKGIQIIAATNEPEKLREDLKWRFEEHIEIPPLRDRKQDIFAILYAFLRNKDFVEQSNNNKSIEVEKQWIMSPNTLAKLLFSPFPGNIRELINAANRSYFKNKYYLEKVTDEIKKLTGKEESDSTRMTELSERKKFLDEHVIFEYTPSEEISPSLNDKDVIHKIWESISSILTLRSLDKTDVTSLPSLENIKKLQEEYELHDEYEKEDTVKKLFISLDEIIFKMSFHTLLRFSAVLFPRTFSRAFNFNLKEIRRRSKDLSKYYNENVKNNPDHKEHVSHHEEFSHSFDMNFHTYELKYLEYLRRKFPTLEEASEFSGIKSKTLSSKYIRYQIPWKSIKRQIAEEIQPNIPESKSESSTEHPKPEEPDYKWLDNPIPIPVFIS